MEHRIGTHFATLTWWRNVYTAWISNSAGRQRSGRPISIATGSTSQTPNAVFAGVTFTFEDGRFNHGEQRFVTLGLLDGQHGSLVHTETSHEIRVISFRPATPREARIYFAQVGT